MTLRRGNRRNNLPRQPHNHQQSQVGQRRNRHSSANLIQPSDYESEPPTDYLSDLNQGVSKGIQNAMAPAATETTATAAPTRTNEELNLAVLRRYCPEVTSILSLAPYAVVYLFNSTTQLWEKEKVGIEGTLFVCQLTQGGLGEERYSVFVLNRRGTENFETRLSDGDDVKLTDDYVILRVDRRPTRKNQHNNDNNGTANNGDANNDDMTARESIYGLWIFSEPAPSSTAETRSLNSQIIKECAVHGGQSKKLAEERRAQSHNPHQYDSEPHGSVPMGRQISLQELFGQQRAHDDEWSVKAHGTPVQQGSTGAPIMLPWSATTVTAGSNNNNQSTTAANAPAPAPAPSGGGGGGGGDSDVLGDLFRKAGLVYQGSR